MLMSEKELVRGYVSPSLKRLLKAVITLRMDKDWTVSDVLQEAIVNWLKQPENQAVIQQHRLTDLMNPEDFD